MMRLTDLPIDRGASVSSGATLRRFTSATVVWSAAIGAGWLAAILVLYVSVTDDVNHTSTQASIYVVVDDDAEAPAQCSEE